VGTGLGKSEKFELMDASTRADNAAGKSEEHGEAGFVLAEECGLHRGSSGCCPRHGLHELCPGFCCGRMGMHACVFMCLAFGVPCGCTPPLPTNTPLPLSQPRPTPPLFFLYAGRQIYVEIERARLTKQLARIREEEGNIQEAAEILQEVPVVSGSAAGGFSVHTVSGQRSGGRRRSCRRAPW
jgi:hypothetical protein